VRDHPPGPDDQDVAEADLGALGGEAGSQVGQGDGCRGEGVEGGVRGVGFGPLEAPGVVVYQDAAADYALF